MQNKFPVCIFLNIFLKKFNTLSEKFHGKTSTRQHTIATFLNLILTHGLKNSETDTQMARFLIQFMFSWCYILKTAIKFVLPSVH